MYQEMVVCPSLMRTTKSSLPVSVDLVTLRVIYPVYVSRLPRSLVAVSWLSGPTRRKSQSIDHA
jgi:hypothetical protein